MAGIQSFLEWIYPASGGTLPSVPCNHQQPAAGINPAVIPAFSDTHADRDYAGVSLSENALYQAARFFAGLGLYVLPCVPWTKSPCVSPPSRSATRNIEVLQGWWKRWPNANPAIATGRPLRGGGGRLVVLDFDDADALQFAAKMGWPVTTRTLTRRGEHHFMLWTNDTPPKTRSRGLPGMDLKGSGSQVLAPCARFRHAADGMSYVYRPVGWTADCLSQPVHPSPPRSTR